MRSFKNFQSFQDSDGKTNNYFFTLMCMDKWKVFNDKLWEEKKIVVNGKFNVDY